MADKGMAHLLVGRDADALAVVDRALQLARKQGARGQEAHALRLLGHLTARRDAAQLAEAECRYREALALADELGMRPLVTHCHLGLGELYERTDRRQEAQEHLGTAATLYREMGMQAWLPSVEARRER